MFILIIVAVVWTHKNNFRAYKFDSSANLEADFEPCSNFIVHLGAALVRDQELHAKSPNSHGGVA